MDRQIEQAVEIGEKNQRTVTLVRNWCAHARVEKFGGTGVVEQMTGLPIGHHSIACDYASPGNTISTWDLADAALDFYDRNCVGCAHRKPVGLPNLSMLAAERDAAARTRAAKDAAAGLEQADALRKRKAARDALRVKLAPPSQSLVDHLDALDTDPTSTAGEELVAAAELAPDAFPPELVEFLFALIESGEHWATETALVVLDKIGASPERVANGALRSLARYGGVKSAEVLLHHIDRARADLVGRAVPMLIHHAEPADLPFLGPGPNADPRFLLAVHEAFPAEVERVIADLLEAKDLGRLSDGARGVCVLGEANGDVALRFARTVISKLARTNWLDDSDSQLTVVRGELRRAAALAFSFDPVATEVLIDNFRMGASANAHKELLNIYQWVLRRRPFEGGGPFDAGERAAFDRMIALASNPPSQEVERELGGFFAHGCYSFKALAAEKVDALLGAAALLADALDRLDARNKASPASGPLEPLERYTRRSGLAGLQSALTELAAEAAAGDPERTRKFLSLLANIPPERTELRRALISQLHDLITSPETLSEILPALYSALVGASTFERGAAARTIGKMRQRLLDDAPPLLLEAFVALLSDQFLLPVSEAMEALERIDLPDGLRAEVRGRLGALVVAYAKTSEHPSFLVQAIDTLTTNFLSDDERAGRTGEALIKILETHALADYYRELRAFAYRFKHQPAFGRLVLKALEEPTYRHLDGTVDLLSELSDEAVVASAAGLEALIGTLSLEAHEWRISQVIIEAFTRSGLWDEALRMVDTMLARLVDVPRNRSRRLHLASLRAAVEIEHAVAGRSLEDIASLAGIWREASARDQEDRNRDQEG